MLRTKPCSDADTDALEALLQQGLREVAEHRRIGDDWCLPRKVSPLVSERRSRKRKADGGIDQKPALLAASKAGIGKELHSLSHVTEPNLAISDSKINARSIEEPLILSSESIPKAYTCSSLPIVTNKLVCNPYSAPLFLQRSRFNYKIPPNAKFLLSKVVDSTAPAFSMAALTMYPNSSPTAGPGQFDFILLDPPWENRSVRRSARYDTMRDTDPIAVLRAVLGQHIAPGALVGCWITNRASIRDTALQAFQAWDVQLIEEWAWLKITVAGLPVAQIDGLWRKPYEILLLGRKHGEEAQWSDSDVQRRAIVAVPDLHSRKPHLRCLIEPFLPAAYRALEVFARNLTAKWCSLGDEVLKYNWDGHWHTQEGSTPTI